MSEPHPELVRACRNLGDEVDRVLRIATALGGCQGQEWAAQYADNVRTRLDIGDEAKSVLAELALNIRESAAKTDYEWTNREHPDAGPSDDDFDAIFGKPEGPGPDDVSG